VATTKTNRSKSASHANGSRARAIWKGAISFGLVNVPVVLYPAAGGNELDLDLLDKNDFSPVGYQRINKRTGKAVERGDIVKGYEYQKGRYALVTDEDFRQANVKATQTIDVVGFVDAGLIAPYYYESPYYLAPGTRGEKGYALLRETLRRSGKVGLATVVIRTRQRLAALIPVENVLVLDTLRFADEIRPAGRLDIPGEGLKSLGISARELEMAQRLVAQMAIEWKPEQYHDTYKDDLLARIRRRVKEGQTHVVTEPAEKEPVSEGAQVIDLMSMLKRSLEGRGQAAKPAKRAGARRGRTARGESTEGERRHA
jgi:DNA end-binding protein Ku